MAPYWQVPRLKRMVQAIGRFLKRLMPKRKRKP